MDQVYHIFNRGIRKQPIFKSKNDWSRFLFLLLNFQSSTYEVDHIARAASYFGQHSILTIKPKVAAQIIKTQDVKLIAFCLQPNHFHLLVQEITEGGIAKYMQRIGNSHTKYFNTKYEESGHLFQNRYQSVLVNDNDQLLYTSAYIHKHTPQIDFSWSSYQDYIRKNRWPGLLDPNLILDQFDNGKEYDEWLKSSAAKEKKEFLDIA